MKTLTQEERLHRIHVLMMDIEIAKEENHMQIYCESVNEARHYLTHDTPPTKSSRWETQ